MATDEDDIHRFAALARGISDTRARSIWSLAAAAYGARPVEESTVPTGFDPKAAALFECMVEGAYLVASADHDFDDAERAVFERVLTAACHGAVPRAHVAALVATFIDAARGEGREGRERRLMAKIQRSEHVREVLRIGAIMARASRGVGDEERATLARIAAAGGLTAADVDAALVQD